MNMEQQADKVLENGSVDHVLFQEQAMKIERSLEQPPGPKTQLLEFYLPTTMTIYK